MSLKGAANIISTAIVAAVVMAGVGWIRSRETAKLTAVTVAATEQGVNHVVESNLQQDWVGAASNEQAAPPGGEFTEGRDATATYQPAQVNPNLSAQVDADDAIQIAIDANVELLNDLICAHSFDRFSALNTETIIEGINQGKDPQAIALEMVRVLNQKTKDQADVGGYGSDSEATGIAVAHTARVIAALFVIQDIRRSHAAGSESVTVRACAPTLWNSIATTSDALLSVQKARAANRSEAIRALQRSEVASDGL